MTNYLTLHPQFIVDEDGNKKSVILSIDEYEAILDILDDIEDTELIDEVTKNNETYRDFEVVIAEHKEKGIPT